MSPSLLHDDGNTTQFQYAPVEGKIQVNAHPFGIV